jgi:hemerythrin-like metal-binding protein
MDDCSSCHESARGSAAIDREHDIIVKAMAGLHNAVLEGRGAAVIVPLVDLLARFCAEHFANEEGAMRDCDYTGVNAHAAAHEDLLRTLIELQGRSREDVLPTIVDTMDLLGRLSVHTDRYDREAHRTIQAAANQREARRREECLSGTSSEPAGRTMAG